MIKDPCPTYTGLVREREAALARGETEGLVEVIGWLIDYESRLDDEPVLHVAYWVVQLGIEPCASCDCLTNDGSHYCTMDAPWTKWLHVNHARFNRAVHELLREYELLGKMRGIIRRDINAINEDNPEYGQIVLRDYGRKLIAGFLTPQPSAAWVG